MGLNIVYKNLKELVPYENNPRKIDKRAVEVVKNSILNFGIKAPLVIDKNNIIVCGHTRHKALCTIIAEGKEDEIAKIDFNQIPCIMADDLDDEQIKALRLVDNKSSELSKWDDGLLDIELNDIQLIDMSIMGFDLGLDNIGGGTEFDLPDGDKPEIETMTLTLHREQKKLIEECIKEVKDEVCETFTNTNAHGNAVYEVFRQWKASR